MQGIVGVLAVSGLSDNQTTEAELEIERFINIFLLLEQDIFPNDPHIGGTIFHIRRDIRTTDKQKTHLAFWKVQDQLAALVQYLAIKTNFFEQCQGTL
jgi:hypothetical protein